MTTATAKFHDSDHWGTLFPMKTNHLMIQHHSKAISEYIYEKILNDDFPADCFLPQQRVFATKPRGHLRRTVKLDPVAEFFLYDVTLRNKGIFRKSVSDSRASFGYRFMNGEQIPLGAAYKEFKTRVTECRNLYKHHIKFDIASYFNNLYHHDVADWFSANDSVSEKDKAAFGKFMREINSGRSIDFMPQGIYSAKMIGSEFLKFIDLSGQIKSAVILRFMDDFHLFDDSEVTLNQDFIRIQQLLGTKALNINPSKTIYDDQSHDVSNAVSEIRKQLYTIVEVEQYYENASGVEMHIEEHEVQSDLDQGQIDVLLGFLKDEMLDESDADLILNVLKSHCDTRS